MAKPGLSRSVQRRQVARQRQQSSKQARFGVVMGVMSAQSLARLYSDVAIVLAPHRIRGVLWHLLTAPEHHLSYAHAGPQPQGVVAQAIGQLQGQD